MQRVRLYEQAIELDEIQELAQSCNFTTGVGGIGALGDHHAQAVGVQAHLGDETRCTGGVLSNRAPESLTVTYQGVDCIADTRLNCHPLLQQSLEPIHIELRQQQPEGRVRGRLADVGAEQLVERLAVPLGKTLYAQERTVASQDREDRHQQHPPLRKAHTSAHPAIQQRLEKADQIGSGG